MITLLTLSAVLLLASLGMASDDDPVSYRRRDARRINRAVRGFEAAADGVANPAGGVPWTYGVKRAVVTTAIPTGSVASPSSSGRITIKVKNSAGAWVDGFVDRPVWNDNTLAASIPSGRACKVAWIAGEWWLVSASCS